MLVRGGIRTHLLNACELLLGWLLLPGCRLLPGWLLLPRLLLLRLLGLLVLLRLLRLLQLQGLRLAGMLGARLLVGELLLGVARRLLLGWLLLLLLVSQLLLGARLRLVAELLCMLVGRPIRVLVMLIEGGQVLLVGKGIVGGGCNW